MSSFVDKGFINENIFLFVIIISLIYVLIIGFVLVRIEQIAGYYECSNCYHRYISTFITVFWAMHIVRTRYMRCPKCGKWSWNKKILSMIMINSGKK